jgi:hypothetical protein
MVSISFSLLLVFVANFFIEPTACGLPAYLQNRELDDITSLRYEFPSIIGKIRAIGMLVKMICNVHLRVKWAWPFFFESLLIGYLEGEGYHSWKKPAPRSLFVLFVLSLQTFPNNSLCLDMLFFRLFTVYFFIF